LLVFTLDVIFMASGGGEQCSREDCDEEHRCQTNCYPGPNTTMRLMTSRSTVAWPIDRDAVVDCLDAVHLELCRRRALDVTVISAIIALHFCTGLQHLAANTCLP